MSYRDFHLAEPPVAPPMKIPVCAGDDPMQLAGSPCCSGTVTLAFQIRLLHTGATITSTTSETPAMLNLLHGLLLGHEKPDNSLHPLLLASFTRMVLLLLCLPPSLPHNGPASKSWGILSKLCPAHLRRLASLLVII